MTKYYLNFITSGHGRIEIVEPVGLDKADFTVKKENDRIGIDSTAIGAKERLTLYHMPNHCLDIIFYNIRMYGYETVILFDIEFDEDESYSMQVDMVTRRTDFNTFFEFSLRDISTQALLKHREEIQTNLFSETNLNGNFIPKCEAESVLLKAKPIIQRSQWEGNDISRVFVGYGQDAAIICPFPFLKTFDVKTSLSPFFDYTETQNVNDETNNVRLRTESTIIKADTYLRDIKIKMTGVNISVITSGLDCFTRFRVYWGTSYNVEDLTNYHTFLSTTSDVDINNQDYEFTIPELESTGFIFLQLIVNQPNPLPGPTPVSNSTINVSCDTMDIEVTSIARNSVVKMVRLVNALNYVVASSSGLETEAKRWEEGSEFYDQFITTMPLLRGLTDKPFNLSFKDITDKYFPEVYGEFQIQKNGKVFMGRYPDFYPNVEIGAYDQAQFENYSNEINPRYAVNQFNYKYSNFASQKENEESNTYDVIHGEKQGMLTTKEAINKKEVTVGVIRDSFMIDQAQRKANDLSNTSATQDDDKKYILDVVAIPSGSESRTFRTTANLRHTVSGSSLILTNDTSFSFISLGIIAGTVFTIENGANSGSYIVTEVENTKITLAGGGFENIPELNTTFVYFISEMVTSLMTRTKEGFDVIEGLLNGDEYANLRRTVGRNIRDFYSEYLSTCNLYAKTRAIKTTLYNNNPDAVTRLIGESESIREGNDFMPSNPILTPELDKVQLIMTMKEWFRLEAKLRNRVNGYVGGFIRYFDGAGYPRKGYIMDGVWNVDNRGRNNPDNYLGVLTATIEEKHEPFIMTIFGAGDGVIVINGQHIAVNVRFEIDKYENLRIFDETGKLMFMPTPYNRVRVNSSEAAINTVQLIQWITAITS